MAEIDQILTGFQREDEEKHAEAQAKALGLPYINLVGYPFAPDVLAIIPQELAVTHRVVSYLKVDRKVTVASDKPDGALQTFLDDFGKTTQLEFSVSYCSKTSLETTLALYGVLLPKVRENKVAVTDTKEVKFSEEVETLSELREKISKVSTTELLDLLFTGAVKLNASDIHLEPGETNLRLRYRIDGVLQDVVQLPMNVFHNLMSRIKYMAALKLDVTHPQDGRFEVQSQAGAIDIRVATLPTSYGEAVTMRLLPKNKEFLSLESLGFSQKAYDAILEAISKPQGMIINTGPTGSGKTTTLYAILKKLNVEGKKIITIEDPIEYRVPGIEQVQVTHETEREKIHDQHYTLDRQAEREQTNFIDALKGCLRQDPDILMVGEIRDKETANIALQAAMTGHLVLTTVHANNAPSTLARLNELGVELYLLSGTINLIIGQRLVRRIHKECGGKGCDICHNSGYKGRVAIIEVLKPGPEIEKLIEERAPLRSFEETAEKVGMETMYQDGMNKVAQGITTKEEVERVSKE